MLIMLQPFNRLFTLGNKSVDESSDHVDKDDIVNLEIKQIIPNEFQPRKKFDDERIKELAQTLHTHGMIQPIIVREKTEDIYELVAGERRWRAAQYLNWETIPAIIRTMTDTETASIALIENIQREELSVIEEGKAYAQLIKMHSLTQEALAQRLGKSQSTVANRIRLLSLPQEVQEALGNRNITERHARALMRLKDEQTQLGFLNKIIEEQLNVRETDELVKAYLSKDEQKNVKKPKPKIISKDIRIVTNTIRRSLKLIESTGVDVETEEEDLDDYYQITIKVKK